MASDAETVERSAPQASGSASPPVPGLVVVYSAGRPVLGVLPLALEDGGRRALEIGRALVSSLSLEDVAISRRHARIELHGDRWRVEDLGSRNGTIVDGTRIGEDGWSGTDPRVVRVAESLFVPVRDVRPYVAASVETSGELVIGPLLAAVLEQARRAGASGETLYINGESGSGKEIVARAFHAGGPAGDRPFVAVNCAAIPENIAERLLFGARKGAYSGAEDAEGYLRSASGGTLFLDEVADLSLAVQAKLLRVLETHEVVPLGASRGQRVDIRICSATHKGLRAEVAANRFRADLFYRLGLPLVTLPPLRERPEEVVFLVSRVASRLDPPLPVHIAFVEECLLRRWPGNVRELLVEVRAAGLAAIGAGERLLQPGHLAATAGVSMDARAVVVADAAAPVPEASDAERERIETALRREQGNVTRAARALGMHRNQLRRWLAKQNPEPKEGDEDEEEEA